MRPQEFTINFAAPTWAHYRIQFEALEPIAMPEYAGSAIRGALGHALKDMACFSARNHHGHCQCSQQDGCFYQQLFDPLSKQCQALQRQYDAAPPLMVQAHHLPEQLDAGQTAHFDVVVLGQAAITQWPIIQLALQKALKNGIGVRHPQRGTARILAIQSLPIPTPDTPTDAQNIGIELVGHTRLQVNGNILTAEQWQAPIWLQALLRRYTLLQESHQLNLPCIDWPAIKDQVTQMTWQEAHLHDVDWVRYSNRQKKTMSLNGVGGRFVLKDVSPQLQGFLHHAQWLHVGKNCVFGLGQYRMV